MKMDKKTKIVIAATAVVILAIAGLALAVTIITAPEHITGNPGPTPAPTPIPPIAELHLTSNNTVPFYMGDTLHLEAKLTPAQAGITVKLYNNGVQMTTAVTDSNGVASFDRKPSGPFDFTAEAELS